MTNLSAVEWKNYLNTQSESHIMQTCEWGELKSAFGWSVERIQSNLSGAQILYRNLPFGKSIGYIPKGPVGTDWGNLWNEIDEVSKKHQAIFLKVEPDLLEPANITLPENTKFKTLPANPIQPRRTILVSLKGNEGDWMARMKQKTRYNIRLAEKKEIIVRQSDNIDTFCGLMEITGKRDKFGVHNKLYFQKAYDLFRASGKCTLLEAVYVDEVIAGLIVFAYQRRSWYFYGASSDKERNRMPAYLLQWEAMRWAASQGCEEYDLWGIPDFDEAELESAFNQKSEDLWGVYRFKRGFGGNVVRSIGAFDRIYQPGFYNLYTLYLHYFRKSVGA